MNEIGLKIVGDKEVYFALSQMADIDRNKAIKIGLRKGANILVSSGKRKLKDRMKSPSGVTGNLLRAFTVKVKKNKLGALAGFGMVTGRDGGSVRANHSYLVDLGTGERSKKNGSSTGTMPALKFWTDTRNEDMEAAVDAVFAGVEMALMKM